MNMWKIKFVYTLLQFLFLNVYSKHFTENAPGHLEAFWFTNFPNLPLEIITSKSVPDGLCAKQLALYQRDLRNGTMWAVQMYDASVKQLHGIVAGNIQHFGNFDQCYNLEARIPSQDEDYVFVNLNTRYCLVDIEYHLKTKFNKSDEQLSLTFDPTDSVWEAIREKGDLRRFQRYRLQYAICVPAACTAEDLELALKQPMIDFSNKTNLDIKVLVNPRYCQSRVERGSLSPSAKLFCALLFMLFTLVVSSTFLYRNDNQERTLDFTPQNIVRLFNARSNIDAFFKVTHQQCRGIDFIYTLRVFFMCTIVFGHRLMRYLYISIVNAECYEKTFDTPALMIIHNGFLYVDIYFAIGGLLVSYGFLNNFEVTKSVNITSFICKRIFRLFPVYLFTIAFYATLLPYLGTGPNWKWKVENDSNLCKNYWWANILFINNYMNSGELCMFQSWYLAADFQSYIIAYFILYAFCYMPRKVGYSFLACVMILSCAIPFYLSYVRNVEPMLALYPIYRKITDCTYYANYYVKTEIRISAYLAGLIAGVLLYDCKFTQWRLSKTWSRILFTTFFVFGLILQRYGHNFIDPNIKTTLLEKALYGGFHRVLFAAAVCALLLIITIGTGLDSLYTFFTPKWIQRLDKLTYCTYMTHHIIQTYDIGVARVSDTFAYFHWILSFFPDLLVTYFLSFFLFIAVEQPFRKLGQLFLQSIRNNEKCVQIGIQKKVK